VAHTRCPTTATAGGATATAGKGWGGRCAMALEPLKEAFEGILGFNLGVPMHRRSLATDDARDSMDCRIS